VTFGVLKTSEDVMSKKKFNAKMRKYNKLPNGATFHLKGSKEVCIKISDAFSITSESGKDVIPGLFDTVIFTGLKKGYFPLYHW